MSRHASAAESPARIWKATAGALLTAAAILLAIVWPLEYGIDPTSIGRLLGISRPAAEPEDADDELAALMAGDLLAAEPGAQKSYQKPFKSEQVAIRLAALEEVEFKARMREGDTLLYSWASPEPVYVDMHGEPSTYPQEKAVRYEEVDGTRNGHGRLTATFPGLHGWYWMNISDADIVIDLRVSGYYDSLEEVFRSSTR